MNQLRHFDEFLWARKRMEVYQQTAGSCSPEHTEKAIGTQGLFYGNANKFQLMIKINGEAFMGHLEHISCAPHIDRLASVNKCPYIEV